MSSSKPSVIYGAALIAGGSIGAGMFSLPIVSAGMWFGWSAVALVFVWWFSYQATLILLESNLQHPPGASFNTLVRNSLGRLWAVLNNVGIAFVMYILLYAYFSAGGSILLKFLQGIQGHTSQMPQNVAVLLFGGVMAVMVWVGAALVGRICAVLLVAMVASFAFSTVGLLMNVEMSNLIDSTNQDAVYGEYIWAALPYYVTAFACAGMVPSLVKIYGHDSVRIRQCLLYGTLTALVIYFIWLLASFGNISRPAMANVIHAGGNMGDLVMALQRQGASIDRAVGLFSNFAITTSFLSIGLSLFDFLSDSLKSNNRLTGRSIAALLTFVPPAVLSFFYPHGFVLAIGYAGLVVLFSFFVVPVFMALKNRQPLRVSSSSEVSGRILMAVLLFAAVIALFKIAGAMNYLAVYPNV